MGLFGFLANLGSATVKTVVTPLAIVKDVVDGEPFETTGNLLESAGDDVDNAFDDLLEDDDWD